MKDVNCIFCKIVAGEVPGEIVYKDEMAVAFKDIHPLSPVHLLIVPRAHIASLAAARPGEMALVGHLVTVAAQLAVKERISESGYRVVVNSGPDGDQAVPHLHVHLLGGRRLSGQLG